jgi:hypothetical protein
LGLTEALREFTIFGVEIAFGMMRNEIINLASDGMVI